MNKFISFFLCLIIALVFSGKSYALIEGYETDKVKVDIIQDNQQINVKQNFELIVRFEMKNGWHIFANPAGDIGRPTSVILDVPDGFSVAENMWSFPKKFENEGIIQFGYDDIAYNWQKIIPVNVLDDRLTIPVKIEWLACKDECIPEKFETNLQYFITESNLLPSVRFEQVKQLADESFIMKFSHANVWWILLSALLGGLILNFMPCVFPILFLKIMSLLNDRDNMHKMRTGALLYLSGVVLSFIIIAAILVLLRLGGEDIGWGFQLQSPVFVGVMLAIFVAILFMLLDFFNFQLPFINRIQQLLNNTKKWNALFTGFFAVLIASPCTAPFMGIAISFALTQPLALYFPIFIALGVGYALPFTLIGFFPKFISKLLPTPGKWMVWLKKVFAVPVFLTCIWLGWLLYHLVIPAKTDSANWNEYDKEKIEELVNSGKSVFIDFTAKWCLTCLMNKKMVLDSEKFLKIAQSNNIYLFRADWTNENSQITQALKTYGRNSIPLYVYYDGLSATPQFLPQILTLNMIEDYLE